MPRPVSSQQKRPGLLSQYVLLACRTHDARPHTLDAAPAITFAAAPAPVVAGLAAPLLCPLGLVPGFMLMIGMGQSFVRNLPAKTDIPDIYSWCTRALHRLTRFARTPRQSSLVEDMCPGVALVFGVPIVSAGY